MARNKQKFLYTYRSIRRHGRYDGRDWEWTVFLQKRQKEPRPRREQKECASFEGELRQGAVTDMQYLAEEWTTKDEKLKRDYCRAMQEKNKAEQSLEKETAEAEAALRQLENIEGEMEKIGEPEISSRARNAWLIVLGVIEFPINYAVFQLWGESIWMTVVLGIGLGAIIPLLAHFTGHRFRQEKQTSKDRVLLWAAPFVTLGLLTFIAFWRGEFMSVNSTTQLLGLAISPVTATLLFVLLNLAFFFVALFISYEGTHSDAARYRRFRQHLKELRRQLAKESGEAAAAVKREEQAAKTLSDVRTIRERRFEGARQEAQRIAQTYEHLVTVYRNANLSRRNDSPPCFRLEIQPAELPAVFAVDGGLDWTCT